MWYAAHIVILYQYQAGEQSDYPMREHIVLVEAADPDIGYRTAGDIGRAYAAADTTTEWAGRPVHATFADVRRLVECGDSSFLLFLPSAGYTGTPEQPGQATEPTYSFYRAEAEAEFTRFRDDRTVELWYEEQGADEAG